MGDCTQADCDDVDLVVCLGGDGTVFGVQRWLTTQPLLAVNSDPQRSIGHVTRLTIDRVAAAIEAWENGSAQEELLPRLQVCIADKADPSCDLKQPFLNDCLFTNQNPAEMTRYKLESPDGEEVHYSSGVWISTAAGSTAAIASAGFGQTFEDHESALLFLVREPFTQRCPTRLIKGAQLPPQHLALTAALPGMQIFDIDGAHSARPVPPDPRRAFQPARIRCALFSAKTLAIRQRPCLNQTR